VQPTPIRSSNLYGNEGDPAATLHRNAGDAQTFATPKRYLRNMNMRPLWLICALCAVLLASDALAQDAEKAPPPASKPAAKDKATDPAKPKAKAKDKAKEPATAPATPSGNPPATPPSDQPAQQPADANGKSDAASGGKSAAAKRAPEAEARPCKPLDQLPPEMHKWANLAMSGKFKEFTRLAARRQALYVKSSELRMAMRGVEPTERQVAEVKSVQDEIGKVGDQMDALTAGKGWTQEDYAVMDFIVAQQFELNPIK